MFFHVFKNIIANTKITMINIIADVKYASSYFFN